MDKQISNHPMNSQQIFSAPWVVGTGLTLLLIVHSLIPAGNERYDWTQFLVLGSVFPGIVLALSLLKSQYIAAVKLILSLLFYISGVWFIIKGLSITILILAALLTVWILCVLQHEERLKRSTVLIAIFVSMLTWIAATKIVWWQAFQDFLLGSPYKIAILGLAFVFVAIASYGSVIKLRQPLAGVPQIGRLGDALAILVLATASLRTDSILHEPHGALIALHHWGAVVGPAEMVRQGGWLLWDTPSQYGFLNTLILAYLPLGSVWKSFYIMDAAALLISAIVLYGLLRSLGKDLINWAVALVVTLAAIFLLPGDPNGFTGFVNGLSGPMITPLVGGYRFLWCYILLLVVVWSYRNPIMAPIQLRILAIGCMCYLVGVLWSSESAIYSSATWLPAYTLIIIERFRASHRGQRLLLWLGLPVALVTSTAALISIYYVVRLRHVPDWYAFVDYLLSFSGGFGSLPISIDGAVWYLLLAFFVLASIATYLMQSGTDRQGLYVVLAALGCIWSTTSYFIGRSHEVNSTSLFPLYCAAITATLYVLKRRGQFEPWLIYLRASVIPLLVILLTATFGNLPALSQYLSAPQEGYAGVENLIPRRNAAMNDLFRVAGIQPNDPVVFLDNEFRQAQVIGSGADMHVDIHTRYWLPIAPEALFIPLSDERSTIYSTRFITRRHEGGWLIWPKGTPIPPWLYTLLTLHYKPVRSSVGARYIATLYAPADQAGIPSLKVFSNK